MIPRILHQIWIGPNKIPIEFHEYSETWRKLNPQWRMELWTDEKIENKLNLKNSFLYNKATSYAEKADIARYHILFLYGGLYVDMDYECLKPIDKLMYENMDFIACKEADDYSKTVPTFYNNGLLACSKNHPIMEELIMKLSARYKTWVRLPNKDELSCTWRTGPHYLSDILNEHHIVSYPIETFNGEYALHHYTSSWLNEVIK